MTVPQVAIVGRPNVGKSSLFNWLVGRRLAIVHDQAGVTRDRMIRLIEHDGRYFELVDSGGIGIEDVDNLTEDVERQIAMAIDLADVLLLMIDVQQGITPLDRQIVERLRKTSKPILLVASKCDLPRHESLAAELFQFGLGEPLVVSAKMDRNRDELLAAIIDALPPVADEAAPAVDAAEPEMKIAIVGRRNVGKSTLVNALVQAPRMIVSEVAGTTRDSVDVRFEMDGKPFVAIDTPGLRRTKSVRTDIDFYGTHRAQRSIRYADVVLMLFEANSRISKVDRQLCHYVAEHYKPCILVVNKWDLMSAHMPTERWGEYLRENFPMLSYAPIAFTTAASGRNVRRVINLAQTLFKQARLRVPTPQLNRAIRAALERHAPPISGRRRPKIYFAIQIGVQPPTIVLKCNDPQAFSHSYRRYLLNSLRDQFPFGEIPIRLLLDQRARTTHEDQPASQ